MRLDVAHRIGTGLLVALFLSTAGPTAHAQTTPPKNRETAIKSHLRAVLVAANQELNDKKLLDFVADFDRDHAAPGFIAATSRDDRRRLLTRVLQIARRATSTETTIAPDWVRVDFFGRDTTHEVTFKTQPQKPFAIISLEIVDVTRTRPRYALTTDNLADAFADLADSGFTGVAHVRKNGQVLLDKTFGMANKELSYPIRRNTVFGIGSTPMDFTYVAIMLLEQQGKLDRDDSLEKFFDDAPADKRRISIRQLMHGASGLPDFFDTDDDWDADLAYIDRETAERRLFSLDLLFEPGTDSRSSHGAYGLLASIIERASGQDYYAFLKQHFFDPAGMTRTAMNGDSMGLPLSEFAVGQGPVVFGLPNIPPNWGKTSWLILGSGGMCSTIEDMLRFFALVRTEQVLSPPYNARFNRSGASLNGSNRGAYLSHAYDGAANEAIVMSNIDADSPREGDVDEKMTALVRALEEFIID